MNNRRPPRIIFFRPVFFAAVYITLGILTGYYAGRDIWLTAVFVCAAIGLALFDWIKNRKPAAAILLILMFGLGTGLITLEQMHERIPNGESAITGRVVDTTHYEYASYYTLDDWQAADENITVSPLKRLRVKSDDSTLAFGDVVTFSGTLDYPDEQRNRYGFNERLYLLSKDIAYTAEAADGGIAVIKNQQKLDSAFYLIRRYVSDSIDTHFSESTRGIAKGLILGDKSNISESDYNAYRTGGAASILAVSGLHFGIISLFIFWLMRLIGIGRKPANIATGIIMLFYAGVVGFTVSAVRALIMGWLVIAASLLGRRKDYFSFLCAAYVLSLILRPSSLFTVGFLLSFGAVYAVVLLGGRITAWMKGIPKFISASAAASFSATLGTAPILINFFNYVSLIGVLANLIIIPMASVSVVLTLLSVLLGDVVGGIIAIGADQMIRWMNSLMNFIQSIPYAAVNIRNLPVILIILWFVLIFMLSDEWAVKRKLKRIASAAVAGVIVVICLVLPLKNPNVLSLYFFDVGQGDAILIETPDNQHFMVDTSREYAYDEIERYLLSDGIHLDGLFLTHADSDHTGGYQQLIDNGFVSHIYIAAADDADYGFYQNITIDRLSRGDRFPIGKDTLMRVIHPEAGFSSESDNQLSLCMMIEYKDYKILLTGDIDDDIEQRLSNLWLDVDVLKVAHHGSRYGSTPEFLSKTTPEIAVIQCGENVYGHPADETLYHLKQACDIIYRTDTCGGIMLTFGDDINSETVIDSP